MFIYTIFKLMYYSIKFIKLSIIALLLTLSFSACNILDKKAVSFTSSNIGEELADVRNLNFKFNQSIVSEEQLNKWIEEDLLDFEPLIKGRYKWVGQNELLFVPAEPIPPCQNYKVSIAKLLLKQKEGKQLRMGRKRSISFHTPYTSVQRMAAIWNKQVENSQAVVDVLLDFNHEMQEESFEQYVKLLVNEKPQAYTVHKGNHSKQMVLRYTVKELVVQSLFLKVEVKKGLQSKVCQVIKDQSLELNLPSYEYVQVVDWEAVHENGKSLVRLFTNQAVFEEDLNAYINFSPPLDFEAKVFPFGIEIYADFIDAVSYKLSLKEGLTGVLGGQLEHDYQTTVFFGEKPASISFVNKKAIMMSSKGSKHVGLRIHNVPLIHVRVAKVFENNIIPFLDRYNLDFDDETYYWNEFEPVYQNPYAAIVYEREIAVNDLPKEGNQYLLNLDLLSDNQFKGIYYLEIKSADDEYRRIRKIISISDLGIIARQSEKEMMVMVNSLLLAEPVVGSKVQLISHNNQVLQTAETNNQGVALFTGLDKMPKDFEIGLVSVAKDNDHNYLYLNKFGVETSRFDIGGAGTAKSGWWTFIHLQRSLYRPGETVFFNTITRNDHWKPIAHMDVIAKLLLPGGGEFDKVKLKTNAQGAAEGSFEMPQHAGTGYYKLQITDIAGKVLQEEPVFVEMFVPDKIRMSHTFSTENPLLSDSFDYQAVVKNLFGSPAANRRYDIEFAFSTALFKPKNMEHFNFNVTRNSYYYTLYRQGETNQEGAVNERFKLPSSWLYTGAIKGTIIHTVFDETGRPLNRSTSVTIHSQKEYVGIYAPSHYVNVNKPAKIQIAGVDLLQKPIPKAKVKVEIVKIEWQNLIERRYNTYRYNSSKRDVLISSHEVNIKNGIGELDFIPRVTGQYEIRVYAPGSPNYVQTDLYAYGFGTSDLSSFELDPDGEIIIDTDKDSYKPGDKVKLLFKTPFKGKMLVTLERDRMFSYHVIKTDKQTASFEFKLSEEHMPNVFVTATLIRPLMDEHIPLTVAHGYQNIMVANEHAKLDVIIQANEVSRSKTKQVIKVKTKPNAEVVIAVVDEGVLQIKNFETPNPLKFFYQSRRLNVKQFDLYAKLFTESSFAKKLLTGGGGDDFYETQSDGNSRSKNKSRASEFDNVRIKPVAFWSNILKADAQGNVSYTIDVPDYYGELRIMAVAYKDNLFGSASKYMQVFDPIMSALAMPRFVTPNDEVELGVNVFNTTDKDANVKATVVVNGPLKIPGNTTVDLVIPAKSEQFVNFPLVVLNELGNANVKVQLNGLGEKFENQLSINVRQPVALVKHMQGGMIFNSNPVILKQPFPLQSNTASAKLVVDHSPFTAISGHLSSLVTYPHGCAEQSISKAFPQLYIEDILAMNKQQKATLVLGQDLNDLNPTSNVQEAINALQFYQRYDGGIATWRSNYDVNDWTSVYALHFLLEAKAKGFQIPENLYAKLVSYVKNVASNYGMMRDPAAEGYFSIYKPSKIYALYVLAKANIPDRNVMNMCNMNRDKLTYQTQAWLALAFAEIGDKRSFNGLLPKEILSNKKRFSYFDQDFGSDLRDNALFLNALFDIDPQHSMVMRLLEFVAVQLSQNPNPNTQELAFASLALGKFAAQQKGAPSATLSATAQNKVLGKYEGERMEIIQNNWTQLPITLSKSGKGNLFYFFYSKGLSANGKIPEKDQGIIARKSFFTRDGKPANLNALSQGDLIVVKLSLKLDKQVLSAVNNIVLTDMLPACFEIENPRLNDTRTYPWITNNSYPESFDPRDDRINYYVNCYPNRTYEFYYMVRVVSKGVFSMGPVSADAMYNNSLFSYNGSAKVKVN
jgi:uncharacterized protein YfaS (alpha-2-macroglobulin family)